MRRIISIWLPHFATDRLRRTAPGSFPADRPVAAVANRQGAMRLAAVDRAARAAGLGPGMALADARAILPELATVAAEPLADARALGGLAAWCRRYTPWSAVEGEDGILLDISGCAHLFGGEDALLDDLAARLERIGYARRLALADTPGAATALARFGPEPLVIVPPGKTAAALAPLPVAALRLEGAAVEALNRLGLRRIRDLEGLPRAPLAARFTRQVTDRLDRAHGRRAEPVSPEREAPRFHVRLGFAEPIGRTEDVAAALGQLLETLCALLTEARRGARRLRLTCFRTDGTIVEIPLGLGRPAREPGHIAKLFARHLDGLDAGFGIDAMALAATATDALGAEQIDLAARSHDGDRDQLVDRLANRLGPDRVLRFRPVASHLPERAVRPVPAAAKAPGSREPVSVWPSHLVRPVRLLRHPEPVEAVAPVPDDPPLLFRWQGRSLRLRQASGPERIAAEWWRRDGPARDYYRVEAEDGRRFWLYREGLYDPQGSAPRWFLHGFFA
jgi:protein ImuB